MTPSLIDRTKVTEEQFHHDQQQTAKDPSPQAVEALRLSYLGRKGKITALLEDLRQASKEERPIAGKAINQLRQAAEQSIEKLKSLSTEWMLTHKLAAAPLDISLPPSAIEHTGSLHPVTLVRQQLLEVFQQLGFTVYDGPEIDFEFFNFTALNIPEHHPARDMQDTFYIKNFEKMVLRTHTSNIQIHAMLNERPPLRIIAPGRVFRCDSDMTHTPMFHQIEGFVVDENISFSHLKGTLDAFLKAIYGPNAKTRFRPSFFPFVEPGAEFDVQCSRCQGKGCRLCKNTGWIEIGGCGMIHPNVFESVGYDSSHYSGFAFGFGMDRVALNKYSLPDLRQLFEGNYQFLGQFPINY